MTHVFCNWKLMSLHFPHLFLSCIPSPLAATCLFSVSMIPFRSVTLVHLFLFLDSIYMWNHTIFVFLFIYLFLTVLQSYHICLSLSLFFFFFFVFLSFCLFIPGCAGSLLQWAGNTLCCGALAWGAPLGLSASGVQAQWLWHWAELARSMWDLPGLGSDLCPFFCRWILNHWTTREDQYLSFFVWLILLSIIPSRFFHVLANGKISFFLGMSSIPLYRYTTSLSIHPSVGTWVPTT